MGRLWEQSNRIEFDNNGDRADGALAYFFEGNTTTPLTVFEDAAEATPHDSPVEADANGRWPAVFVPFIASYDVQAKTEGGSQLYYTRAIPNPDPVEQAEESVADITAFTTGMWHFDPVGGVKAGWVRANGRTIGSASSGATERANADTSALYTYLWNGFADSILAVATGRGGSAAADFAANKAIALFNAQAATIVGVDDMGNTAAGALAGSPFTTGNATTGGSVAGANTNTLSTAESAAHLHSQTGFAVTSHAEINYSAGATVADVPTAYSAQSTGSTGGGGAHNNLPKAVLGSWYVKL